MTSAQSFDAIPHWTVGDRLRKARAKTGLSTRDFAEEIGVSQKTVTDAENDKRGMPRKILLNAYAMRTKVPVSWLINGDDPSPTSGHTRTGVWTPRLVAA